MVEYCERLRPSVLRVVVRKAGPPRIIARLGGSAKYRVTGVRTCSQYEYVRYAVDSGTVSIW